MVSMAFMTSRSTSRPSWALKRAARMMRSGSSSKDCSADTGVRRLPSARSARPPQGSTRAICGRRIAIALTVKSRRVRSPSSVSPKVTSGLRDPISYSSVRYVVTSTTTSPRRPPIVPNSLPMSHVALPHWASSSSVRSGRAEVVMSKSCGVTPRKASRTGPPTSASSSPASSKIVPSSIIAGGSAANVFVALAMRVGMSVVPAFCGVTGPLIGEADWVLIASKHARKAP